MSTASHVTAEPLSQQELMAAEPALAIVEEQFETMFSPNSRKVATRKALATVMARTDTVVGVLERRIVISIERCRLRDQCTQRWETLEILPGNSRVRYCSQCQSAVHMIARESEFEEFARQGKCVAVSVPAPPIPTSALVPSTHSPEKCHGEV